MRSSNFCYILHASFDAKREQNHKQLKKKKKKKFASSQGETERLGCFNPAFRITYSLLFKGDILQLYPCKIFPACSKQCMLRPFDYTMTLL